MDPSALAGMLAPLLRQQQQGYQHHLKSPFSFADPDAPPQGQDPAQAPPQQPQAQPPTPAGAGAMQGLGGLLSGISPYGLTGDLGDAAGMPMGAGGGLAALAKKGFGNIFGT